MFCMNCGKEISDNSKFCGFCGTVVASEQPVAEPITEPAATEEIVQAQMTESIPAPAVNPEPVIEPMPDAVIIQEPVLDSMPGPVDPEPVAEPVPGPVIIPEPVAEPMPGPVDPEPVAEPIPAPVVPEQPMITPVQEMPGAQQPQGISQPQMNQQYQAAPQSMAPGSIPAMAPAYGTMPGVAQPVPPTVPSGEKKKKGKAGLIIFLVIFLVLIIAGGVVFFVWMNRPAKKIASAFAAGDVSTAIELYEKVGNKNDIEDIKDQAQSYARGLMNDYIKESKGADYRTVNSALEKLYGSILRGDNLIKDMIDEVNYFENSREAYRSAEQYKQDGDYVNAIWEYAYVVEDDTAYYKLAQTSLVEAADLLRDEAIKEANNYVTDGYYEEALEELDDAMYALGEYEGELNDAYVQILNNRESLIVDDALILANDAIAQERYGDALKILNEALVDYPDNADLLEAKRSLSSDGTIYGTWAMECDLEQLVGEDEELQIDEPLVFKILFDLSMDGTFRMYADEESVYQVLHDYLSLYVYSMFEDSGFSKTEIAALIKESAGVTIDEYVDMMIEESDIITDVVVAMDTYGIFEIEDDRIYMADEGTFIDKDFDIYNIFTLEGNILTISQPDGVYEEPIVEGLSYPFILTKVE